ncbi:hypothetical protein FSP39_020118 [Pinctada imbricata]|uniref:Uncharacterized protein n=1 Tax=Pinctada imbricata TaxID=66713 RepID=A0AA89BZ32_PINIB|nr:hypothetical protein FSP39_020118 [Pinctada imbricata]
MCEEQTVCTEISTLPSIGQEENYFSWMSCSCPSGQICPSKPGKQTLRIADKKWYGMCQPVVDIPECAPGDLAEEMFIGGTGIQLNKYTEIHCLCPEHELSIGGERDLSKEAQSSTVWARTRKNDPRADTVYEFMCAGDWDYNKMKRGGRYRGRGRGSFRKFYFYK